MFLVMPLYGFYGFLFSIAIFSFYYYYCNFYFLFNYSFKFLHNLYGFVKPLALIFILFFSAECVVLFLKALLNDESIRS